MQYESKILIEKWFVAIALLIGGVLLFITPPMASPDEGAHFFNAYAFSEAAFFPETVDDTLGRTFPNCIVDFVEAYNDRFPQKLDQQYRFSEAYASWAIASDFGSSRFKEYRASDLDLIAYLPSGIGIILYRVLAVIFPFICLSPYNILMVGRISNLIFYTIIIYYAIKWTPVMKYTIFLISLFPMSIFLASTLSYDTMIIGSSALLFSRVMNVLHSKRIILRKDIIVISVCSFVLINVKSAYAPLLIVLLSVAVERFGETKRYIRSVIIVLGVALIQFIGFRIVKSVLIGDFTWKYAEAMNAQTKIVLSSPFLFVKKIWNSFIHFDKFYYLGCIGSLGQQDTNIPEVFMYMLTFVTLFTALVEVSSQNVIKVKFKLFSLIGIIFTIYVMFAGTYVIWTAIAYEIGLDYVEGIQGRYFIPLIIWVVGIFANSKLMYKKRIHKLLPDLAIASTIFISIITLICVFVRFWVPVS